MVEFLPKAKTKFYVCFSTHSTFFIIYYLLSYNC